MNYQETTEWMFKQLPMYQLQGARPIKKDLTNIHLLVNHLGNPHKNLKCIHVAGTNGKGLYFPHAIFHITRSWL
jgi:dihydrofolate synthase/folylpolyglutamate synthase